MGSSKSKEAAPRVPIFLAHNPNGACFKVIDKRLQEERKHVVNKVEGQVYSLTQVFPEFNNHYGSNAILDLCVLSGRVAKIGMF